MCPKLTLEEKAGFPVKELKLKSLLNSYMVNSLLDKHHQDQHQLSVLGRCAANYRELRYSVD